MLIILFNYKNRFMTYSQHKVLLQITVNQLKKQQAVHKNLFSTPVFIKMCKHRAGYRKIRIAQIV